MWFSLHHHPTPQYFLHPSKNLLPIIVIVSASFEEFKGKDTFSLSEWSSSSAISIFTKNYITFTWLSQESCLKLKKTLRNYLTILPHEKRMNVFRLTGDLSHLLAILLLLWKMWRTRSCAEKDVPLKVEDDCTDRLRRVGLIPPSFDTEQKQIRIRTLLDGHVGFQCGRRTKFFCSRFKLYPNAESTFQLVNLLVSGDIDPNPGPEECPVCRKAVASNHRACPVTIVANGVTWSLEMLSQLSTNVTNN